MKAIILGAGISGVALAHFLQKIKNKRNNTHRKKFRTRRIIKIFYMQKNCL